jgi:hypothetical protein
VVATASLSAGAPRPLFTFRPLVAIVWPEGKPRRISDHNSALFTEGALCKEFLSALRLSRPRSPGSLRHDAAT